jgi:2-polyprenyl-3-methyl-5-hydroxy-6-metoxy-1,4-benzoquinol methylase
MWEHALRTIRCPRCKSGLRLNAFQEEHGDKSELISNQAQKFPTTVDRWVETGALCCDVCTLVFPVHRGVPILFKYKTQLMETAFNSWPALKRNELVDSGFQLPSDETPKGEKYVGASFSAEWAEYEYGPTLWIAPTADRLRTFRGECGLNDGELRGKRFCEIGCGLGITTNEAAAGLGAEAWGVDLSNAVFRAASQYKANPLIHFVQASVFAPPFESHQFDFVYSHGVLHHTWSTKEALRHAANLVRNDGGLYVWLYGYDDVRVSVTRRLAFAVEVVTRPLLARLPSSVATVVLSPLVPMYKLASIVGKLSGTHASAYSAKQALHAARDRFTPLYAHRHEFQEVASWLKELGFKGIHRVMENEVALSWGLAIKRNVAIRASRE